MTENQTNQEPQGESEELNLLELIQRIIDARWWILVASLVFGLAGGGVGLLTKTTYSATATIFPISSSTGASQFASIASILGVSLPSTGKPDSGKTIGALLESRFFAEELVQSMNLTPRLFPKAEPKDNEALVSSATKIIKAAITYEQLPTTGVMAITVELEDPLLAQEVANGILAKLDELLAGKSFTVNKKMTESLEKQIQEQSIKVNAFQQELAKFQRDTQLLDPKQQSGRAMDSYLNMVQQKMNLELQLQTARASYSAENPKVKLLTTQIENLNAQIAETKNQVDGDFPSLKEAPENIIRFQNLTRDLEIATKIYTSLLASLEQARLQEDQDQLYIEPLDKALLPTNPNQRWYLPVVIGFLLGLFISMGSIAFGGGLVKIQAALEKLSKRTETNA